MKFFLLAMTVIISLLLIAAIVAQESKQPGMGSAVGGGTDGMIGGKSRGKDAFLVKITIVLGIAFAVLCLAVGRYMNTF